MLGLKRLLRTRTQSSNAGVTRLRASAVALRLGSRASDLVQRPSALESTEPRLHEHRRVVGEAVVIFEAVLGLEDEAIRARVLPIYVRAYTNRPNPRKRLAFGPVERPVFAIVTFCRDEHPDRTDRLR